MSWLDDMEAADPAYPNPGDDDPWAGPGYVPGTSRGIPAETAYAASEWARQENITAERARPEQVQPDPGDRRPVPARDLIGGWAARHARVPGVEHPGRDWHLVRDAQAAARTAGLRATVPQPDGQHAPQWQADAQAWGTGRGIEPDGPQAG
jgi:hypothetical protein